MIKVTGQERNFLFGWVSFESMSKGVSCKIGKTIRKLFCNKSLWKPFIADNCVSTPVCSRCISLSVFLKGLNAIIFNSARAIRIEDQTL